MKTHRQILYILALTYIFILIFLFILPPLKANAQFTTDDYHETEREFFTIDIDLINAPLRLRTVFNDYYSIQPLFYMNIETKKSRRSF